MGAQKGGFEKTLKNPHFKIKGFQAFFRHFRAFFMGVNAWGVLFFRVQGIFRRVSGFFRLKRAFSKPLPLLKEFWESAQLNRCDFCMCVWKANKHDIDKKYQVISLNPPLGWKVLHIKIVSIFVM